MTTSEFRFQDYLHILRRYWLFAFILIIAGGMSAYFFSNGNPEVFEAYVNLPVAFRPGAYIDLRTLEEDASLDIVIDVVKSETILSVVSNQLASRGESRSVSQLAEITSVTMINDALALSVLDSDGEFAKTAAEIWAQTTYDQLQIWVENAEEINKGSSVEEDCFSASAETNQLVCGFIEYEGNSDHETGGLSPSLLESAGMIEALWIGEPGDVSVVSHQYNFILLIFAGFFAGLILYAFLALILISNQVR